MYSICIITLIYAVIVLVDNLIVNEIEEVLILWSTTVKLYNKRMKYLKGNTKYEEKDKLVYIPLFYIYIYIPLFTYIIIYIL